VLRSIFAILIESITVVGPAYSQAPALLLFGDSDHKTFLGCINCSQFDSSSICNQSGQAGSQFNSDSIWNQFGHFGSRYSSDSPWNAYSSSGPVIVDRQGNFYGRLSANKYVSDRTRIQALNQLADLVADGMDLDKARDAFCGT
jgi:hypothetical protein